MYVCVYTHMCVRMLSDMGCFLLGAGIYDSGEVIARLLCGYIRFVE